MNEIKVPSNRSFGIVFFIVFLLISIYPLMNDEGIRLWSLFIAIIILILGLLNSKLLTVPNKIWLNFGLLLSKYISPIIMFVVFFLVVTPTGIILKIFKKDILNLKFNNRDSYWLPKEKDQSTMKDQF